MDDKEMLDFSQKLEEAYNRWLNAWMQIWISFFKKTYEEERKLSEKFINDVFSEFEKQFNLVKNENERNI
jgi:hypothetical protein